MLAPTWNPPACPTGMRSLVNQLLADISIQLDDYQNAETHVRAALKQQPEFEAFTKPERSLRAFGR